jgi:hypothetical protein
MSASLVRHNKIAIWSAPMLSALLRHLSMGTLATIMLVALALLSATHGKETKATESTTAGIAKSGVVIEKHHELIGAVRPGASDYRTASAQGYLKVYSAPDESHDGGLGYYSHSSYAIYTSDGQLFKRVENHRSRNDQSPELVPLPAGSYLVIARSDRDGDVSIPVAIKASQLTVLDLDLGEEETLSQRLSQTFLNLVKSVANAADPAQRQVA